MSRHPEPRSAFRRRSSAIDVLSVNTRRSSLAFRKNEQVNPDGLRRLSLLDSKTNGDLNKNFRNLVVKVIENTIELSTVDVQLFFIFLFQQYDHIDETRPNSTEQVHILSGSNESVNQFRSNIQQHHRNVQGPTRKYRDSVPYRVMSNPLIYNNDKQSFILYCFFFVFSCFDFY